LELTRQTTPEKIEVDLMEVVPKEQWTLWPHLMIHHGRAVCTARRPECERCPIFEECPAGPKILAERKETR